jgi:O-antigen ligase
MTRLTTLGLCVGVAVIPLYGQLAGLDPTRPPMPLLVPLPVAAGIGLVALAALVTIVPAAMRAARRDALTFALLSPGLVAILAGVTGFDPRLGIGFGLMVTGVGASGLVLARAADVATVRLVVRTALWSAMVGALVALAMDAVRRPAAIYAYANGRAVGTFLNPNELAAYALVVLGIALPLAVASRGRDRLAVATSVVLVVALGATFSRWGAFSAVCGVAAYALFARRRVLLVAALAVALGGLAVNAVAGNLHHNPRDTAVRLSAWQAGLTTFERFPLLGVGPLAYGRTYAALRPPDAPGPTAPVAFDPHSLLLACAAEEGVVGLVMLVVAWGILLRRIARDAAPARQPVRMLGFGLAAALVALLADSALNTVSLVFPLFLQVAPLALAVVRTDAL